MAHHPVNGQFHSGPPFGPVFDRWASAPAASSRPTSCGPPFGPVFDRWASAPAAASALQAAQRPKSMS